MKQVETNPRFTEKIKNTNLYVMLESQGGIFSSGTYPFLEVTPFTLNAPI